MPLDRPFPFAPRAVKWDGLASQTSLECGHNYILASSSSLGSPSGAPRVSILFSFCARCMASCYGNIYIYICDSICEKGPLGGKSRF